MVTSIVFAAVAYGCAIVVSAFTAVMIKLIYSVINREGNRT
jgi:uncharacterized membrane protein YqgA involved in biofilm formation